MITATELLKRHIENLVSNNSLWQTFIADEILWELAYAPSLGHPKQLSGKEQVFAHASWFAGAVENFNFSDLKVYELTDSDGAIAEVRGEGLIKSTGRIYSQMYVIFLRSKNGKITFMREYFDPVKAAKALDVAL